MVKNWLIDYYSGQQCLFHLLLVNRFFVVSFLDSLISRSIIWSFLPSWIVCLTQMLITQRKSWSCWCRCCWRRLSRICRSLIWRWTLLATMPVSTLVPFSKSSALLSFVPLRLLCYLPFLNACECMKVIEVSQKTCVDLSFSPSLPLFTPSLTFWFVHALFQVNSCSSVDFIPTTGFE